MSEYSELAEDLAQQFSDCRTVYPGNLNYLRDFSDASRKSYDLLMDRVADMYGVIPRDVVVEGQTPADRTKILGASALKFSD